MATSADLQVILPLSKKLRELEAMLAKELGPQVLDYLFLFSKEDRLEISFEQLTTEVQKHIQDYIQTVRQVMALTGISDETPPGETLQEAFLDAMHDIYLIRYVEATRQFADYQLVRVPTRTEQQLLDSAPVPDIYKTVPAAMHLQIPGSFIVNDMGNIDVAATVEAEATDHHIVSHLSAVSEIAPLRSLMFADLQDVTIFENVPVFLKEELLDINETILQTTIVYFAQRVYSYIARGQSPLEAKANVAKYFQQVTTGASPRFPEGMQDLEKEIDVMLEEKLNAIPSLFPETRLALVEDYKELLLLYMNDGTILPKNYYELRLRDLEDYAPAEKRFNILFDLYLYLEDGQLLPIPVETYNIDLTQEARELIFEAVTAGLVNPNFTLQDYLTEVS